MPRAVIQDSTYGDDAALSFGWEAGLENSPEVVVYHDNGPYWEAAPMTDTLKIITFAGQSVPEDGLTVNPPQGGELTIWPDGGYSFMPPDGPEASDGGFPVTTYYSFVMEDIDGSTSVGTFALDPSDEMPEAMQDFQAWSLPELLDAEADAARVFLEAGEDVSMDSGSPVIESAMTDMHVEYVPADANLEDDLNLLIIYSQNS